MIFVTIALLRQSGVPVWRDARAFSCVSSQESISDLVCRPEPYPLSRQALRAVSLDQFLIGDALTSHGRREAVQPRQGMILDVALVQPEGKLINVPAKMLWAGVMVDADQAALENREDTLDAVGSYATANELALAVIDGIVSKEQTIETEVPSGFVGMDSRTDFNPFMDFSLDRGDACVGDGGYNRSPAPLTHSKNRGLADTSASGMELLAFVFVPFNSANISFVNFDNPPQFVELRPARLTEPMQNEPCRLLSDTDFLGELHRRDTFAGGDQQVHRIEPLVQWNVRSLEDSAGTHREVFPTGVATIEASSADRNALAGLADSALWSVRPETAFEIFPSRLLVGVEFEQLEGADS
jgi:hypothetical protein